MRTLNYARNQMLQTIEENRQARKKQIKYVDYGEFGVDRYDKIIDHLIELLKMGDMGVKFYIIETEILKALGAVSKDTREIIKARLIKIGKIFADRDYIPDEAYSSFYDEEIDIRISEAKDALQLCKNMIEEYKNPQVYSEMHGRHTETLYRRKNILESRIQELKEKREILEEERNNNTAKKK